MNRCNVKKLIKHLEQLPDEQFYMRYYFSSRDETGRYELKRHFNVDNTCNSAACIAGHACVLMNEPYTLLPLDKASKFIDLDEWEACEMFRPRFFYTSPQIYPRARAIAMLKNFLATGSINWNVGEWA